MALLLAIAIIAALAVGFGAALLLYRPKLEVARSQLADRDAQLLRDRAEFAKTIDNLQVTFKGLSSDVLKESRDEFLKQAEPKIAEHVKPLAEALRRYDEAMRQMEGKRDEAYGGLKRQVELLAGFAQELKDETGGLKAALTTSSAARGRWGEVTLRRIVELAGMSAYCDFDEQVSAESEGGRKRPDMLVHIPGGRTVVVDAKTPLDAYLKAVEATSERDRQGHLAAHAQAVRDHLRRLSQKSYWESFASTTDFVVMFLPGESFAAAALEVDRDLFEDGMKSGIIVATPATLIALLRSFAMGWQQERLAENAEEISKAGKELFERCAKFADHFGDVGGSLERAIKAFNSAIGSWESRVVPGARRLKELGATKSPDAELPQIKQVESIPRQIETSGEDAGATT